MKKIREVSMMSGITRRTLQYYDDEGILPVERTKENYRLYDEKALRKLWEI
ncbi:MAG: MerR family transcriptional regulator, partial [Anaerovoracaceae bacterium]